MFLRKKGNSLCQYVRYVEELLSFPNKGFVHHVEIRAIRQSAWNAAYGLPIYLPSAMAHKSSTTASMPRSMLTRSMFSPPFIWCIFHALCRIAIFLRPLFSPKTSSILLPSSILSLISYRQAIRACKRPRFAHHSFVLSTTIAEGVHSHG